MQKSYNFIKSTKQVFDDCAPIYLKEDKHWGCDLDIIKEFVEKFEKVNIVDLGVGHAWHLVNIFYISSININNILGIDYSEKMIGMARKYINALSWNNKTLSKIIKIKKDNILSSNLKNDIFDIALFLNNTLGNIPGNTFIAAKNERRKALSEIYRILRKRGFLILSVYNASRLKEEDKYGKVFELDNKLSNLKNYDLIIRYKNTNIPYYSHWFKKGEIEKLLRGIGFHIVTIEERRKRIIVVAQKND